MGTKANVSAAKGLVSGAVYRAVLDGTTTVAIPTTSSAELTGFTNLGYVSSDGLTNASTPGDSEEAWCGDVVFTGDREDTIKVKLIESLNANVLTAVYGAANVSVASSGETTVQVPVTNDEAAVWVFDMLLKGNRKKRIVVPHGVITEMAEVTYVANSLVGYDITIKCSPDSTGTCHYEYIAAADD